MWFASKTFEEGPCLSRASRKSACTADIQAQVQVEAAAVALSALASAACLFLMC